MLGRNQNSGRTIRTIRWYNRCSVAPSVLSRSTHPLADTLRGSFLKLPNQERDPRNINILPQTYRKGRCASDEKRGSRLGLLASSAKLLIPVETSFTNFSMSMD